MKSYTIFLLGVISIVNCLHMQAADQRIEVSIVINGKDLNLIFDTGYPESIVLFDETIRKFNIKAIENAKRCEITYKLDQEQPKTTSAAILGLPGRIKQDGILGWTAVKNKIFTINWKDNKLNFLGELPKDLTKWKKYPLFTQSTVASIPIVPNKRGALYFDTGSPSCLDVSSSRWKLFLQENNNPPSTLNFGWSPATNGNYIQNVCWAESIKLGSVNFKNVFVAKNVNHWMFLEGSLGLEGMKHFEIIFDRQEEVLYLKDREYSSHKADYNRLGAAFLPKSKKDERFMVYVLENSPADKAGLCFGDILIEINGKDKTKWKTEEPSEKKQFYYRKTGSEHTLIIEREGKRHTIKVVLEDILGLEDKE